MTRSAEFGRFSSVVMVSPYSRWAPVSTHARPTHRQRAGTNLGPSGILSIFLTSRRRHLELRTRTHAAAVANPAGGYRGAATTRNQTRSTMRSAAGAGRGAAGLGSHHHRALARDQPREPARDVAGRLGAERVGEHWQPLAQGGGLVVDDVVDAGLIVFEREHGRCGGVVEVDE